MVSSKVLAHFDLVHAAVFSRAEASEGAAATALVLQAPVVVNVHQRAEPAESHHGGVLPRLERAQLRLLYLLE